jgi:cell division protein FtsL
MTRLNLLLLFALIGCALSVVTSRHQERKANIDLETARESERKLDQEWRELLIESQTLGTGKRIEQKASRDLGMVQPDAKKSVIVVLDGSLAGSLAQPRVPAIPATEPAKAGSATK